MNRDKSDTEKTAKTFDEYGLSYAESVTKAVEFTGLSLDFVTRVKGDYIVDLARHHAGDASKLSALDVGCGIGNFHPLLVPAFRSVSGVDISGVSIDVARANNPDVDYKVYDGQVLPYDTDSFDVAFTVCVMHHVPPSLWPNFVREMQRVLKPGGQALVFEHNPLNPLTMRIVNSCPFDEDAVLLRQGQTKKLFEQASFKDVYSRTILTVPPKGGVLRGLDRALGVLPLGAQYYVSATK
ncbi:class I SAM-dependent methyltransferase [Phyllobacterium sp. 21LDTY02-6]|uniref:class I SAM-dependent methyltransferase n=1 Tax=unclassified Phyllobacterium TaxID=2638441 RepID=UPI0020222BED|nr:MULTISPECIES: methyltransferase domain-containing protein [unclassified Phyllobacterium]MCO4316412.1 class I SAM-dependent methyltransferase [Phyllobacterium sp. 21LDTY02-6]MCX8280784.1 methyltransferase domain-containing protein [Phyllobacterium sp. 0TCS1.6C]MCX8292639.1 methyltransferase domain-containing protein [Phyllobacterium sp. 0TCS1.6A]